MSSALATIQQQFQVSDHSVCFVQIEHDESNIDALIRETKEELIKVYQALTELGESEKEPIPEVGFAAIEKRRNK